MSVSQLMQFKGIGEIKPFHCRCIKLGRRHGAEDAIELKKITSSKAVFRHNAAHYWQIASENFGFVSPIIPIKSLQSPQRKESTGTVVDIQSFSKWHLNKMQRD